MTEDVQTDTIAFLADPSTHATQTVERADTHASLVFLAGDRVYKLKRAVRYSYLDYSTEPLRRDACVREFELNRRFAPALYLAVKPVVRRDDGTLALGGPGHPIDWVVEMRRFDQADLFDRMALDHRLSPDLMTELAERVADAHRMALHTPDMGGETGIAEAIEATRTNLHPGEAFEASAIDRWHAAALSALATQGELLEHRRRTGKVRACHGDLHLRNICLFDGRPTLFDGIEFSRSIACIDILFDLAFLLMDLHHRDLDSLGNLVFNRYFDQMDESEGLPLLPLFLSLRAGIRAQVGETAARSLPAGPARDRAMAEAHAYLDLAIDLLHPAQPCLVAIGGFSGSGKTTVARGIAPMLHPVPGARVLRSDIIRKQLWSVARQAQLPDTAYGPAASGAVYDKICDQAAAGLAGGCSVIADAVFARAEDRHEIARIAQTIGVPFHGVWLTASPGTLMARVDARTSDASDATTPIVRRQLQKGVGPLDWTIVDAEASAERSIAAAAGSLGLQPDLAVA